ncbi:MAG: hypothetical protein OXH51_11585 [Gemmatimonadetes bacterium]|nr:hypothetical protein [Gemmatimonadota bacterium]
MRKLLVGFAALAIAACQADVMEAVPETPNDRAVTELLALLGSTYDENSDDRLRSALGLPADFPIGAIMYATVDGGSTGVSADFLPPECSIRDGATREEAEAFTRCHARAIANPNCAAHVRYVWEQNSDGTWDIVGVDIYCEDPKF